MTAPRIVAEISKNRREAGRLSLSEFQGRPVVDLRTWFLAPDGEWRPSPKGLALGVRHLPALADAFAKALREAQESKPLANG